MATDRVERFGKPDEVARDEMRPLMDQLVKRMLTIGARFTPVDRACVVVHVPPVERDALAIALHGQLLEVGRKALQVLLVG